MTDGEMFLDDVRRYGKSRALARFDHRDQITDHRRRQAQLAITASTLALFSLGAPILLPLAMLIAQAGIAEARRFRATGQAFQTRRSLDVVGI